MLTLPSVLNRLFSHILSMLFAFPLGIWLIQAAVNQRAFESPQSAGATNDA